MAKIKSLRIEYHDKEGCVYKEFDEDQEVKIIAITKKTETATWENT